MLIVAVVGLNAMIAILGDSFDQAQEKRIASHNWQRAQLIVEYYDVMPLARRTAIEESTRWIHKLVPEALLEEDGESDAWQGRIITIRNDIDRVIKFCFSRLPFSR